MTISLHSDLKSDKNLLGNIFPWVTLYEIQIDASPSYYRIAAYPEDVTWNSQTWTAYPVKHGNMREDSEGGLFSFSVTIGDVLQVIRASLESADNIVGFTTKVHLVNTKYISDATAVLTQEYEVVGATANQTSVSLTLGFSNLMTRPFPSNRFLRDTCRWAYQSTECGYTGTSITAVSVANPTQITSAAHGLTTGDSVDITGTDTTPTTIGTFTAAVVDVDNFTIPVNVTAVTDGTGTVKLTFCDKALESANGCNHHQNQERFGAFPAIPANGIQFIV